MTLNQGFKKVVCPNCHQWQWKPVAEGDKYAFQCDRCEGVFENGKPHLLQDIARYTSKIGGNVCTGFGGLPGEISHRKWYDNK